jgi:arylsulfatase A-like enzyme
MSSKPNIILILNDDMGYSDIGCYGGEVDTPNLNKLADCGVRMSQFYNTARCCPTRASLLTGLHPHQAGVGHMTQDFGEDGYQGDLKSATATIPEVLKSAGYKSYMSGKWHITRSTNGEKQHSWPMQRGFDKFEGLLGGCSNFFYPYMWHIGNENVTEDVWKEEGFYITDAIADNACRYIDEHCSESADEPFFLYTAFTAPHWPLHAKEEDIAKYKGKFSEGWDVLREKRLERMKKMGIVPEDLALSDRDPKVCAWEAEPDKEWRERCMEVYAAQIDCMDQGIGRMLDTLEKNNQLENTIVIFLADNGGCAEEFDPGECHMKSTQPYLPDGTEIAYGNYHNVMPGPADTYQSYCTPWANLSNTPFREYKHWVHEGGIATPFIVHWPKGLKNSGSIVHKPGQLTDVMATLVDVSGAKYPLQKNGEEIPACEGFSLMNILQNDEDNGREFLVWEHEGNKAIRDGRYKAVSKHLKGWELYDIETDRSETINIADQKGNIVLNLAARWNNWADRVGAKEFETLIYNNGKRVK